MPHHALDERHALAETLRLTGPGAPTLCGGWTTAQLAAHLVLRERSIVEAAGRLPVDALKRRAEEVVDREAQEPYEALVEEFDAGPSWRQLRGPVPVAWLWSIPVVREQANLLEYVIHHEDVRRGGDIWEPRPLGVDVQAAVWKKLGLMARVLLRRVPVGLALAWPSHGEIRSKLARSGSAAVTATGDPVELAMVAFGRIPQARVQWSGTAEAVAAAQGADLSF